MAMIKKFLRDPAFLAILITLFAVSFFYTVMASDDKPSKDTPVLTIEDDEPTSTYLELYPNTKSLELYQEYCDLQHQRDAATQRWHDRRSASWEAEESAQQQLISNSTDIEIHRQLFRAQIEYEQSSRDWLDTLHLVDERMVAIRAELKERGEPPPIN